MEENIHQGHRQRLIDNAINGGVSNLNEFQKLELLLTYIIPRKDTNPLAHALLQKFGNFSAVLDADEESLISINGINKRSAKLMKLIPQFFRWYGVSKFYDKNFSFQSKKEVLSFFQKFYTNEKNEKLYLLLINKNMSIVYFNQIAEGLPTKVYIPIDEILNIVSSNRSAKFLILAHNHPVGNNSPSISDIDSSIILMKALEKFKIVFYEHFIFGKNGVFNLMDSDYFQFLQN